MATKSEIQQKAIEQRPHRGTTRARAPIISLDQPGRLRAGHLMAILSCSHSTFYARLKTGEYPEPDGRDGKGKRPYWNTSTIKAMSKGW